MRLPLQIEDLKLCLEPRLPGEVLLAVSVDLEQLYCLGSSLQALDAMPLEQRLVFELQDGTFCIWPGPPSESKPAADTAVEGLSERERGHSEMPDHARVRPLLLANIQ